MRQQKGMDSLLGGVKGVSLSHCFPLSIILTRRLGEGKGNGVAYAEIGPFSSKEEEGGGGDSEEEGGKKSSVLMLWWMSPQSCCVMYSAINARGIT